MPPQQFRSARYLTRGRSSRIRSQHNVVRQSIASGTAGHFGVAQVREQKLIQLDVAGDGNGIASSVRRSAFSCISSRNYFRPRCNKPATADSERLNRSVSCVRFSPSRWCSTTASRWSSGRRSTASASRSTFSCRTTRWLGDDCTATNQSCARENDSSICRSSGCSRHTSRLSRP